MIVNALDRCVLNEGWLDQHRFNIGFLANEGWPDTFWKGADWPHMKTKLKACRKADEDFHVRGNVRSFGIHPHPFFFVDSGKFACFAAKQYRPAEPSDVGGCRKVRLIGEPAA